eukprot:CAMPEP_0202055972 /NCGR_PEP_ID=MMETSP0963-20130614/21487_1 /ASSEMBLY_ACC=CAM_ASM_000494 /TAXON_ID=4773 /ORGANISM="Schizochytrium aggregatum, Strain ATCC28209" /LENGTH=32 /DNA_ID= /DNA_START= /DNA_END= /DNA_ORIENTATION=
MWTHDPSGAALMAASMSDGPVELRTLWLLRRS